MRISEEDRQRAVEELGRHCRAGRLDVDEYGIRLAEAMGAETLADLDHALRDLPQLRIADPRPRPPVLAPQQRSATDESLDRPEFRHVAVMASAGALAASVVFLALAHWIWGVILVVAWAAGFLQGRMRRGRR